MTTFRTTSNFLLSLGFIFTTIHLNLANAEETRFTILHTNDLHSHFKPEKDESALGGVARLKTLIDSLKSSNSLLVDGGDWSEGNIFYNLGAGVESLRMLDLLGYDAAVIGNHDFINGLPQLYRIQAEVKPKVTLLATNVDVKLDPNFASIFPPTIIKTINGIKIGIIGLTTYEFFYDQFLKPVVIKSPFNVAKDTATYLKTNHLADIVFAISHNTIAVNKHILEVATELDFVIGAHDHRLLTSPIVVNAPGRKKPGIIVEAGRWGQYLGKLDLSWNPDKNDVQFVHYEVIPVSPEIQEDPMINDHILKLEALLEQREGPIFHDHIADNKVHLSRENNPESLIGNLVVDSYVKATGVDLAIDHVNLIYGHIHPGPVHSVDVFNANPGIYNPETGKAWTIQTIDFTGSTLSWLFNTLCNFVEKIPRAIPALSGMEILYNSDFSGKSEGLSNFSLNPALTSGSTKSPLLFFDDAFIKPLTAEPFRSIISEIKINGKPIDPLKTYRAAMGGGVIQVVDFLNSFFPGAVPYKNRTDTGIEAWRAVAERIKILSPIRLEKLEYGTRVKSVQPDLAILFDDVTWSHVLVRGTNVTALVKIKIRNVGASSYQNLVAPISVKVSATDKRFDMAVESDWAPVTQQFAIDPLAPSQSGEFEFAIVAPIQPGNLSHLAAIKIEVDHAPTEINFHNNTVVRLFNLTHGL